MKQKVFLSMNDIKNFFLYDYPGLLSQHGMITVLIPVWSPDVRLRHGNRRDGPHKSLRGLQGADTRCQSPKGGRPVPLARQTGGVQGVSTVVTSLRHTTEVCRDCLGRRLGRLPHLGRSAPRRIEPGGVVIAVVSRRKMISSFLPFRGRIRWGLRRTGLEMRTGGDCDMEYYVCTGLVISLFSA